MLHGYATIFMFSTSPGHLLASTEVLTLFVFSVQQHRSPAVVSQPHVSVLSIMSCHLDWILRKNSSPKGL